MIEDLFVPFDLAAKLKANGFDEPCMAYFTYTHRRFNLYTRILTSLCRHKDLNEGYTLAPLWQQVIEWLVTKGMIVRLNAAGTGYEVRAKEWDVDHYFGNLEIGDAIDEALKLIHIS